MEIGKIEQLTQAKGAVLTTSLGGSLTAWVPTLAEFCALAKRVAALEAEVAALKEKE